MNNLADLRDEFQRLADQAPSDGELRRTVAIDQDRRVRRRRIMPYVAVAAAVVLIAGGISVAGAMLGGGPARPASPDGVVEVPTVPLPDNTQLVRHQLEPVTSPVTATPPTGLTGQAWINAPGRLGVSWFDPAAATGGMAGAATSGSNSAGPRPDSAPDGPHTAGYVITDSRDGDLVVFGPNGPSTPKVSRQAITVGGHDATLDTAPADASGSLGFPATERISWQLPDGRWIHVWAEPSSAKHRPANRAGGTAAVTPSPESALRSFAAGITAEPVTLHRSIGIGLTLPGLTVDASANMDYVAGIAGPRVFQCPQGVDPMEAQWSSSSGSGSAGPDGTSTQTQTEESHNPLARCLTATVLHYPRKTRGSLAAGQTVSVGGTTAHVDTDNGAAWADIGDGMTVVAGAPKSAHLSADDLAALVASVRMAPGVTVMPGSGMVYQSGSVGGSSSAVATTVGPPAPIPTSAPGPGVQGGQGPSPSIAPQTTGG